MQTTVIFDGTDTEALDTPTRLSGDESRLRVWESEGGHLRGDTSSADRPACSDLQRVRSGRGQR